MKSKETITGRLDRQLTGVMAVVQEPDKSLCEVRTKMQVIQHNVKGMQLNAEAT
jgi:hypothetical protein